MVYSNTAVYRVGEYGKSIHLSIFTSLKHLLMLFKVQFIPGFNFTP